jgi:hypothetical protein
VLFFCAISSPMPRRDWTREELIVAFNVYCKIPFGRLEDLHRRPRPHQGYSVVPQFEIS